MRWTIVYVADNIIFISAFTIFCNGFGECPIAVKNVRTSLKSSYDDQIHETRIICYSLYEGPHAV